MGLLSLFKQKAGSTDDAATGEFRARAEDDATDAASNAANESKRKSSRRSKVSDPALPEKKRARRRLIGAATLVLTSVIGLPMLFDSEPKTNIDEISIQIPAKDKPLQGAQHSANTESQNPALASANPPTKRKGLPDESDPAEEILPATTNTENAKSPIAKSNHVATAGTASAPNAATTTAGEKKPEVKTESATSQKTEPKAKELTAATKSATANTGNTNNPVEKPKTAAENGAETARALAILDAKPSAKAEKKEPETKVNGKFTVQVAALATQEKINELQAKLKAAGIASHSQKIVTKTGEVTRIRVGPFESKQEAEKMRAKLTGLGLGGTLIPN